MEPSPDTMPGDPRVARFSAGLEGDAREFSEERTALIRLKDALSVRRRSSCPQAR